MNRKAGNYLAKEGAMLFISTLVVNLGNYAINLLLGRWLGPADFSEVSLLVTLMLMLSFWALAFQLTGAKYAAEYIGDNKPYLLPQLSRWLRDLALKAGLALAILLAGLSFFWKDFFQTVSFLPFMIFGAGMPLYLLMSVNRGILQGQTKYSRFALTYQAEMWARLVISVLLVWLGFGINGVAWGITLSFLVTLFVSRVKFDGISKKEILPDTKKISRFLLMILVYECSQILINNSDTVLVKHFFSPQDAGLYAALALMGRIVYFGTWTVVTMLFPAVIRLEKEGKPHSRYFAAGLAAVAGMAGVIVAASYLFPVWAVNILFGAEYLSIAPLLWQYALATALFACANVFVYYHLSLNRNLPAWLMIGGGFLQILLISFYHASFQQVISIQITLMAGMLTVMMTYQFLLHRTCAALPKPSNAV
ncbi:oligosaccharide flippase family protein [Foetidibacter luteolus]|uniref:oligosaccharide flippase family protein n=1 Tax=Foetidibacter luteolus TaxID=2608880 RepID=UPI00129BD072|nr:oligosaccharide flippase family protein [Foetidibacter luteolus]